MKKVGLVLFTIVTIGVLAGCDQDKEPTESTSNSSEVISKSSETLPKFEENQFEVGKKRFTIIIPDFNVIPEGDMVDANGNTWLIMQSEKYENLLIQLSLHNKASEQTPEDYSPEELGAKITSTKSVNYHEFSQEALQETEDENGLVYQFDIDKMEGQLLFISEEKLSKKEKTLFEAMIKSIKVEDIN